jgi:hypothetical protein
VLPIRCPEAFVNRLQWADEHRTELADMVQFAYNSSHVRTWDHVAADFEALAQSLRRTRGAS